MTNSRSTALTNKGATLAVLVVACVLAIAGAASRDAGAAPRKRVVVLDFDGPKADKFHDDLVGLVKKKYTIVPTDKWNGIAEELDATSPTDANVKKIAKKLKIDGVITGKIEKRRDDYLLHLKLRNGKTGAVANSADTKSSSPRLDDKSSSDIKDELLDAIDQLGGGDAKGGDDDDDDAKPAVADKKKPVAKKGDDDDDDDAKTAKKKPPVVAKKAADDDDDDDSPKKSGFGKKKPVAKNGDDDDDAKPAATAKKPSASHDDDDTPVKTTATVKRKPTAKKAGDDDDDDDAKPAAHRKVAARSSDDDDDDGTTVTVHKHARHHDDDEDDPATSDHEELSPSQRAVDADIGLSVTARKLTYRDSSKLANPPLNYNGVPVGGAYIDVLVYPLSIGHKRKDLLAGLGVALSYDKVIKVTSQAQYTDAAGDTQVAALASASERWTFGPAFRYPLGTGALAPVITGELLYNHQQFTIAQDLPNGMTVDIPNFIYKGIEPRVLFRYPVSPKLELFADTGLQHVTSEGEVSQKNEYGTTHVLGFDFEAGGDYAVNKNIFVRASLRVETLGLNFTGNGTLSNDRDGDPTQQDVFGARDTYYGGTVTVGYLY